MPTPNAALFVISKRISPKPAIVDDMGNLRLLTHIKSSLVHSENRELLYLSDFLTLRILEGSESGHTSGSAQKIELDELAVLL